MQQRCAAFLVCLWLFMLAPPAEPQQSNGGNKVMVDFPGVELGVFINWVGLRTGKRFIYEDEQQLMRKKVHIVSPEPIPQAAVFPLCLSVLEANGYTAVLMQGQHANIWKIIPTAKASSQPLPIVTIEELEQLASEELLISQLVILNHIAAPHIINAIQQARLVSQQTGSVVAIQGTNAILITDFLPNVKRIVAMLRKLDQPPPPAVTVYVRLRYAKAGDVAQRAKQFLTERRSKIIEGYGETVAILTDERSNTLIISGEKEKVTEIRTIIEALDTEIKYEAEPYVLKTYILENTTTAKILPTLNQLISSKVLEPHTAAGAPTAISILANDHANALVIKAPPEIFGQIIELIKELDVRRPQVLLEVAIVEFTPSNLLALGVELQTLDSVGATQTSRQFAASQFGLSSLVDQAGQPIQDAGLPEGKVPNMGGSGLTTFITKDSGTSIPILLRALQSTSMTDVQSTPRVLTNDNEEAEISLQDEVPVIKSTVDEGTTVSSFQEFVQAGTRLKIRPNISKGGYLRLEITQSIESFIGVSNTPGTPPAKTSRSVKTVVTVPDGKTVVLGGLTARREVETIDKIPLLGDIPILGYLCQSRTVTVSRTSLYVFITPKIIRHPDFKDLQEESRKKQQEHDLFRNQFRPER